MDTVQTLSKRNRFSIRGSAKLAKHVRFPTVILHHEQVLILQIFLKNLV